MRKSISSQNEVHFAGTLAGDRVADGTERPFIGPKPPLWGAGGRGDFLPVEKRVLPAKVRGDEHPRDYAPVHSSYRSFAGIVFRRISLSNVMGDKRSHEQAALSPLFLYSRLLGFLTAGHKHATKNPLDMTEPGRSKRMETAELARRCKEVAYLKGDFVLRSGRRSTYYLDKYLFSAQPVLGSMPVAGGQPSSKLGI